MGGINYKHFHVLIEIAVNLDKCIEDEKNFSTPEKRIKRERWENKLKKWIKINYEDPGIKR